MDTSALDTRPPAALHIRYCDSCAMSVEHQVFLGLRTCIAYCVLGIRSIAYWVLGHWVLGPYTLDNLQGHCTFGLISVYLVVKQVCSPQEFKLSIFTS